jgi:hypothetical protein
MMAQPDAAKCVNNAYLEDGSQGDTAMKLTLFFALMDILILLAYPIVYIFHRIRGMKRVK